MVQPRGKSRQLGRRLQVLREREGYSLDAAAELLRFSSSKLSRIEHGQLVDFHALKSMLDVYGVPADRWEEWFELLDAAAEKGWWRAYGLDDRGYVPLEADAREVREFTPSWIPGLLQTEDYARAMFHASVVPRSPRKLRNDLTVRMIRQRRLSASEHALRLAAIIDVSVLHRLVGGPEVMADQLEHVARAAALDSVVVQVLPAGIGAHAAMAGGFTILSYGELNEPDVVYVEHVLGSSVSEAEDAVVRTTLRFERLRSAALSPDESVALIRRAAARYEDAT